MNRGEVERLLKEVRMAVSDGRGMRHNDVEYLVSELRKRGWAEVEIVCVWTKNNIHSGDIVHHPRLKVWRLYGGSVDFYWDNYWGFSSSKHPALQIPEHLFDDPTFVRDLKEIISPLMARQIVRRMK